MSAHYLGLDLGGTNVKAGVTDSTGKLLAQISVSTGKGGKDLAPEKVIARMVEAGEQVIANAGIQKEQVAGAGVLAPAQVDIGKGIALRAPNLPLWKNVRIRAMFSKGLGVPAVLENDGNAAAYGEWWAGAGKGKNLDNLFIFTLGTGLGGGLVYKGKVVRGSFDMATEVGHMIIRPGGELCGCGQRGCMETYCSASNTARRAMRELEKSKKLRKKSSLGRIYKSTGKVTASDVAQHAKAGDAFAGEVWDESCYVLALGCISVCHFIDPQMIVLGGGMSAAGKFLLDTVEQHFKAEWWKMTPPKVKIVLAKLGNDAGVIGAAGVAKSAHDRGVLPEVGH